jgi:hypothetical protein
LSIGLAGILPEKGGFGQESRQFDIICYYKMERKGKTRQTASEYSNSPVGSFNKNREVGRWSLIKRIETPIGFWFEEYSIRTGISFRELAQRISLSNLGVRGDFGLHSLSTILINSPKALTLSDDETSTLAEAVAQTIEQRISEGHDYSINLGVNLRKVQAGLDCPTFNGAQVAEILGISRGYVSQIRNRLGLPLLLTQEHIDQIAKLLVRTK